jgi:hypothetical protein
MPLGSGDDASIARFMPVDLSLPDQQWTRPVAAACMFEEM